MATRIINGQKNTEHSPDRLIFEKYDKTRTNQFITSMSWQKQNEAPIITSLIHQYLLVFFGYNSCLIVVLENQIERMAILPPIPINLAHEIHYKKSLTPISKSDLDDFY